MSKLPDYIKKAKDDYRKRISIISVTINPNTESDIYNIVQRQKNKSGYIKNLIKKDIKDGSYGS